MKNRNLLECIDCEFSVCKLSDFSKVNLDGEFVFISSTDKEKSLVCPTSCVPPDTTVREDGWLAFRVAGTLDFSLTGILADISSVLAKSKIPIFAVSTYDTDYVLTKSQDFPVAVEALADAGYVFIS